MSNRKKPGNKRKPGSKKRQSSGLKDHKRQGKILKPPMMTLPNMKLVPWLRDTLPNMLWLCSLIKLYGDKPGMLLAGNVLDRMDLVLGNAPGDAHGNPDRLVLTGEFTSFEKVPADKRAAILDALNEDDLYERAFPWILVRGLQKYENLPGAWVLDGWNGNQQIIGADEPETFLRTVVSEANHGQSSIATKAKAMLLRARFQAGNIMLPKEIGDEWGAILPRYPDQITEEERRRIEPSIRAASMAFSTLAEDDPESGPTAWAKQFWRQNWTLYECIVDPHDSPETRDEDSAAAIAAARRQWMKESDELVKRFLAASNGADPDLYSPDRHEILSGLVYRQLRAVELMISFPALWTMEHGSGVIRGLVEARILVKWLLLKDDAELYERYKDYGRGRLKLLKLHVEAYRDSIEGEAPELDEYIEYLDALVNRDTWEEFQDISVEGSFAGIDSRKMAEQVGLMNEYRLVFQPASANVHGEWATLDQYVLTTCRNPLHRWHRIPNADLSLRLGPDSVELALGMLRALIDDFEAGVSPS